MIKRIIFDLDETLIPWKEEYSDGLQYVIDKYHLNCTKNEIESILSEQEKLHEKISNTYIIEDIKRELNIDVEEDFIYDIRKSQYHLSEYDPVLEETIKYLSNKYDLIVLTNWFADVQKNRLENAHILKYFSRVVGGEVCNKPKSFEGINENYKYEECLMVGDSDRFDIEPSKKLGMKTYKINQIEDLYKLKEML